LNQKFSRNVFGTSYFTTIDSDINPQQQKEKRNENRYEKKLLRVVATLPDMFSFHLQI
jgi:hypothetical protein